MSKQIQNYYVQKLSLDWSIGTGIFYVTTKPTVSDGWLVISPNNPNIVEIVKFTSTGTDINGDYIYVSQRGVGGTIEQTHTIGEPIRMNITAEYWKEMTDDITNIVASGVPNANTTTMGGVEEATASEIDAGTQNGSTGAELFINPKLLNDAHNIPFVVPGTSENIISSNGTDWISSSRFRKSVASNNLKINNTTEQHTSTTGLEKLKEVMVYHSGVIRIVFDLKAGNGIWSASGRIYVNGVAVGTNRSTSSTSYVTQTAEDITVNAFDLVQIYALESGGYGAYVRNMNISYDLIDDTDYNIIK